MMAFHTPQSVNAVAEIISWEICVLESLVDKASIKLEELGELNKRTVRSKVLRRFVKALLKKDTPLDNSRNLPSVTW